MNEVNVPPSTPTAVPVPFEHARQIEQGEGNRMIFYAYYRPCTARVRACCYERRDSDGNYLLGLVADRTKKFPW